MGTFTKPASEFVATPMVKEHIAAAAAMVGEFATEAFEEELEARLKGNADDSTVYAHWQLMDSGQPATLAFDSPLEVAFWTWWRAAHHVDDFCRYNIELQRHVRISVPGGVQYVLDFVLAPSAMIGVAYKRITHWPLIGIELDGHAFHERTPEQVITRDSRDRALQQAGWHIFHFSFSEFMERPRDCLWEVVEFARAAHCQVHAQADVLLRAERERAGQP